MKWRNKPPRRGDVRKRHVFAWWPTQVDEYKVWLETYVVHEKLTCDVGPDNEPVWVWLELERHVLHNWV